MEWFLEKALGIYSVKDKSYNEIWFHALRSTIHVVDTNIESIDCLRFKYNLSITNIS